MVETAVYVAIGALATALVALLALPAISRRAFRLAEARADRDALRGRHAIEAAMVERRAAQAQDDWAKAQIALGRQTAEIVDRDDELAKRADEIARQRDEIAGLGGALRQRETEIAAREIAAFDLQAQRDAAQARFKQTAERLEAVETQAAEERAIQSSLESRLDALAWELHEVRRSSAAALAAANAGVVELERRLGESEAELARLERKAAEFAPRLPDAAEDGGHWPESAGDAPPALSAGAGEGEAGGRATAAHYHDRLAEAAEREYDLNLRLRALASALDDAQTALRAAHSERDIAQRELAALRLRLAGSDTDASLREAIARLGRELVQIQPASAEAGGAPAGDPVAALPSWAMLPPR